MEMTEEEEDEDWAKATAEMALPNMTIEELLNSERNKGHIVIEKPEGKIITYSRKRLRPVYGVIGREWHPCIDIATIVCSHFGKGLFRNFIKELQQDQRICCIKVEAIHSAKLLDCLPRYGFFPFPGDEEYSQIWCRKANGHI